ncbi:MAG: SDR family oxidoreductase [Armatimonadetes bacterium]|nr:SDR family oxidoreductase [Armatimonadota bacterium]
MFDLSGQVAVVTGGANGLGASFCGALATQGADIVVIDVADNAQTTVQSVEAIDRSCLFAHADVTDSGSIRAAIADIKKTHQQVDILVNNAGVVEVNPAEMHTDSQWQRVIDINLSGVFKCSREFAGSFMIPRGYGRIINIGSTYSFVANNSKTAGSVGSNYSQVIGYQASKGGVLNLTRALAAEWAQYGITVNGLAPGYMASGIGEHIEETLPGFKELMSRQCPIARLGRVEELASTIVYLAAKETSYTTGVMIPVDGGWISV